MSFLNDGFATLISFAANSTIKLREKEVQPPGLEVGGGIEITTMRNSRYRTKFPKRLITVTDGSGKFAYDPDVLPQIQAMLGVNQLITITFPDTSTYAFYGFLDNFTPNGMVEGGFPLADGKIVVTNIHSTTGVETAPSETTASASHS